MELVIIAGVSGNGVIGKNDKIPWQIKEDMEHFKNLTTSHPVIMGRKTYESIPEKSRPLTERINYVITRQTAYQEAYVSNGKTPGTVMPVVSLEAALYCIEKKVPDVKEIDYATAFVIGGREIYRLALPLADRLELTEVDKEIKGSIFELTFFPFVSLLEWRETAREDKHGFSFVTYTRKKEYGRKKENA